MARVDRIGHGSVRDSTRTGMPTGARSASPNSSALERITSGCANRCQPGVPAPQQGRANCTPRRNWWMIAPDKWLKERISPRPSVDAQARSVRCVSRERLAQGRTRLLDTADVGARLRARSHFTLKLPVRHASPQGRLPSISLGLAKAFGLLVLRTISSEHLAGALGLG